MTPHPLKTLIGSRITARTPFRAAAGGESNRRVLFDNGWSTKQGDFHFTVLSPNDAAASKVVRKYVTESFFKTAPIPKALDLTLNAAECVSTEMDMYLNSGSTVVIRNASGQLVGCWMIVTWSRDDEHETADGASMSSWHDAAAGLADELGDGDAAGRVALWRDLQYEHLYDAAQIRLRRVGSEWAAYMGPVFLSEEARGKAGLYRAVTSLVEDAVDSGGGALLGVLTNDAHRNLVYRKPVCLDYVCYADEKLVVNGKRVFESLVPLGGISLMTNDGDS